MILKIQSRKREALSHHYLIKLIVSEELEVKKPQVSWEKFIQKDVLEAQNHPLSQETTKVS